MKPTTSQSRPFRVAISTGINHEGIEQFCPGSALEWGNCQFEINPPDQSEFDYWITFARLAEPKTLRVAPENTLFIAGEPPTKRVYHKAFYHQFHRVVSCNRDDPHPRVTTAFLGLPWYVGRNQERKRYEYGYDYLQQLQPPSKTHLVSVVCSDQDKTRGQRERLEFLSRAKHEFGDKIVHFGRGFELIKDKMDAILPYRYHLVLENCQVSDYWTEKLADAYLGWAFPIYSGCPNLQQFFPQNTFASVSLHDTDRALKTIERALTSGIPTPSDNTLRRCRELILNDYNPFARFHYWTNQFHRSDAQPRTITLLPHKRFRPFHRRLASHFHLRRGEDV